MIKLKRAISPVIAISLLVIVSVVAVIGYQSWYNGYQSILFSDTETKSNNKLGNINVEYITDDGTLYVSNKNTDNQSISTIKIGDVDCNINQNLEPGINNISIASCLNNTGTNDVIIVTDSGIIEEKLFIEDINIEIYVHDSIPNGFSFTNQTGISLNTLVYSNTLTPTDYDGPLSVSVSGDGSPQLSVNGGGWTTSSTINNTESLRLRTTSSTFGLDSSIINLTIGNYSVLWEVETKQLLAYSLTVTNDAPISYWKLDETSGTTVADQMSNHDGTYMGSPSLSVSGAFSTSNTGAGFSNGKYVQMPSTNDFKFLGNQPFTIELWTNMQATSGIYQRLLSTEDTAGGRDGVRFYFGPSSTSVVFNRLVADVGSGIGCGSIGIATWHQIVATYNGTHLKCYNNGVQVGGDVADSFSLTSTSLPLRIAASGYSTGWYYIGQVDEVSIYNYDLNASQVKDHYNSGIYN